MTKILFPVSLLIFIYFVVSIFFFFEQRQVFADKFTDFRFINI